MNWNFKKKKIQSDPSPQMVREALFSGVPVVRAGWMASSRTERLYWHGPGNIWVGVSYVPPSFPVLAAGWVVGSCWYRGGIVGEDAFWSVVLQVFCKSQNS